MRIVMAEQGRLELLPDLEGCTTDYVPAFCGLCRTDGKMLFEGQRDLVLPRVLGHEAVFRRVWDGTYAVPWPATSCGRCAYCESGRENLCGEIRIMGFHFDGAYAQGPSPEALSFFPLPDGLDPVLGCFAEPYGCVLHGFSRIAQALNPGGGAVIYGGGTLGLMAAFEARRRGLAVTLVEKQEDKLRRIAPLAQGLGVQAVKETMAANFDLFVNACADVIAFSAGIAKLKKDGTALFFSGLAKNEHLEGNLLNLVHYREQRVVGAYGLTAADIPAALQGIAAQPDFFRSLTEGLIGSERLPQRLREVYEGRSLKWILDCAHIGPLESSAKTAGEVRPKALSPELALPGLDPALQARAQARLDNKAKPLGSLGALEEMAVRICAIQASLEPCTEHKQILVFAGDHGIAEEGVSAYPQEVTGQMVQNFLKGGAAINAFCRQFGIELAVVDMGVNADLKPHPLLRDHKVARGTRNCALGCAMTAAELRQALAWGGACVRELHEHSPIHLLGLGEMGIGNSSSASLIVACAAGLPVGELVGRGTGVDDEGLRHKIQVLTKVQAYHRIDPRDGFGLLQAMGGFELAGIAGAALAAAQLRIPVVLDGAISTAAGLAAALMEPRLRDFLWVGHQSVEKTHRIAAELLGLRPVIDLEMRLGEGTGAAIAMSLMETACRAFREMASFEEAKVSRGKSV